MSHETYAQKYGIKNIVASDMLFFWQFCCTYFKPQLEQLQVQYAFVCSHVSTQNDSIQLIPGYFRHFNSFLIPADTFFCIFKSEKATGKKLNLPFKKTTSLHFSMDMIFPCNIFECKCQ